MKKIKIFYLISFLILSSCANKEAESPETEIEKVSYSLGVNMGRWMQSQGIDSIDLNMLAQAFNDVYANDSIKISLSNSKLLETALSKSLFLSTRDNPTVLPWAFGLTMHGKNDLGILL